ncbi:MAG: helix-turn-helix transcriptional regulator [Candidatus Thiodiazotropha sp. (ex Troendleina suluensis)]|nr:helix-turn-helix transcriptional regulator [Candidatus Thiodiazotropha sp. (ex Troendleina suluensis)]
MTASSISNRQSAGSPTENTLQRTEAAHVEQLPVHQEPHNPHPDIVVECNFLRPEELDVNQQDVVNQDRLDENGQKGQAFVTTNAYTDIKAAFAELAKYRKDNKIPLKAVADAMGEKHPSNVQKYEKGLRTPSVNMLRRYSAALESPFGEPVVVFLDDKQPL